MTRLLSIANALLEACALTFAVTGITGDRDNLTATGRENCTFIVENSVVGTMMVGVREEAGGRTHVS